MLEHVGVNVLSDWAPGELKEALSTIELAATIPVNSRIESEQTILDLTEMEKILREARLISIGECGCRKKHHRCDAPLDVCFSLDTAAEKLLEEGLAKKVSLEEALDALKRSHEAGLVHVTYTFKGKEKPEAICSCCSCCCHSLSALVRFGVPNAVVSSKFVAAVDPEKCINCGKCVTRCQFRARRLENGKLHYDKTRCFGCGVCVSTCPTGSISLISRTISESR
jgi:Pyruvate/2-oxoacid:ferredoxin oxidoreductase delta subunit